MENDGSAVGVFSRAAARYGQVGPDLFGHFGARVVDLLELTPGCSLLDVACGTGAVLAEAMHAIGPAGRAVGVDLTPAMVEQAGAKVTRPHVAVMDAHALGFADNTFDAVASNFALTYFTDPRRALAECCRVLRSRGRFGLVVHDGWWWHDDPRWAWHARLLQDFGNSHATAARRFSDPNTVVAVLGQSGFADAAAAVEPFDLRWADASEWWDWCWSHGYRVVLEEFDAATLDEFRTACLSHLRTGSIEGTLPVICAVARKGE
jgi:O-methyltransferase/aklanonic acid methyltransferase